MFSKIPSKLLVSTFTLSAVALGVKDAYALDLQIVNMNFGGTAYNASGNIDFELATGNFTSTDPFYGFNWTADVVQTFTGPGNFTFASTGGGNTNDNVANGTYSYPFTLQQGQVAAGVFFDWNGTYDIPVLTIFDCSNPGSGCVAAGPDADQGVEMQTAPFPGQAPAFNSPTGSPSAGPVMPPPPIVLANDIPSLVASQGSPTSWAPNLTGSSTMTCRILPGQGPSQGSATVQSDCSSGLYTGNTIGSDSFVYEVSSQGGTDTGTVNVTVSAAGGDNPPNASPDGPTGATTSVATAIDINVLANDTDDIALDITSVALTMLPTNGVATVNATSGAINYQPNAGFCGVDSLKYTVDDSIGQTSAEAIVSINVTADALCSSDNVTIAGGASDPDNDGMVSLSELISAGIPADSNVSQQCVGGCFDYRLTGLTGPTATLVLPLSAPTPSPAVMRKWDGSAWVDFVIGGNDSLASASSISGFCPAAGYTPGLGKDNDCIQMIISDGGPNDQDGAVNGTIIDPVGVGKKSIAGATTDLSDPFGSVGGSGCVIAKTNDNWLHRFDWAVLLGFIAWLRFGRKGRKFL